MYVIGVLVFFFYNCCLNQILYCDHIFLGVECETRGDGQKARLAVLLVSLEEKSC